MTKTPLAQTRIDRKKRGPARIASALERRVLIFAPTGNDARLTADFLAKNHVLPHVCFDVPALCDAVRDGCGVLILAEEALAEKSVLNLVESLAGQPAWSDIPVVLITSGGEASQAQLRRLNIFGPGGSVTVLERPFRPATLISTVEVALRTRQRQYEARDSVEELKRAHDEIQAASRAKDDFLAALSHELRTPLNPALLLASAAADDPALPEEVRLNFETIRKNIELEARLIDDLLDLTRITTGKMVLHRELIDAHGILMDALGTVEADRKDKSIELVLKLNAKQGGLEADPVRLQQVFWNVLKNAVKFTPHEGQITVETRVKKDRRLVIKITDTGIGMNAAEIARVFTAFAQGDHAEGSGSHRFGGLGLGLAISKNLVEMHSGTIVAESAPGAIKDPAFIIELPLAGKTANGHHAHDETDAGEMPGEAFSQTCVLLVEDNEDTRSVLSQLLTARNYKVITANSLGSARQLARQNTFDFLISDLGLPDGDGTELMNELHESQGLKGIAMTGYGMEKDIERRPVAAGQKHRARVDIAAWHCGGV